MRAAERALHCRTALACAAAADAGLPGRFRTWEQEGLMMALATDPALGFLCTVTGISPTTVPAAIDLVGAPLWVTPSRC